MKILITTLVLYLATLGLEAQEMTTIINGVFTGQNVYVKNPKIQNSEDFCIRSVSVNGVMTDDVLNSTAFAIDLKSHNLETADSVVLSIVHEKNCNPSLINPEVISPASSFEIEDILLTRDGNLQWTTKNEGGELPFIIEQYKWDKWVKIGEVKGKGGKRLNKYSFEFPMHFGKNTVRVKQKDRSVEHTSKQVSAESLRDYPVQMMSGTSIKKMLEFSEETSFELYNEYGELVLSETLMSVDISAFPKGTYYLNYGTNSGVQINKK